MKRLLSFLVVMLFAFTAYAQAPFTYYQPLPPPHASAPSLPSIPDIDYNYGYRRAPRRYSSSIPNNVSGIMLRTATPQETISKLYGLGFKCDSQSSGYFTRIVTTNGCKFEDADFNMITFYFFKNKLWSITFEDCQSDAQELGNRIESKYGDHSISDTRYEYKDGDVILTFDGRDLVFQSDAILTLIARSANGN